MLRTTIPAAIALALLSVVEQAHAETAGPGFGSPGQFIIGAERLAGLSFWSTKSQNDATPANMNPPTQKDSGTGINLLWGGDTNVGSANGPIYTVPRVGFDYVVIPSLTVGAALGYIHRGSSSDTTNNNTGVTTTTEQPTGNGFLFNPRVGYVLPVGPIAIWARGGITYFYAKSTNTTPAGVERKNSLDGLALSLDPQIVIAPASHFGITVGPVFDIPLAGGTKNQSTTGAVTTTTEGSVKVANYGVIAGVVGFF